MIEHLTKVSQKNPSIHKEDMERARKVNGHTDGQTDGQNTNCPLTCV